jgi:hypothetical protein
VKGLTQRDDTVFAELNTNEMWDTVNAFLTESINAESRTAKVMRTALRSKTQEDGAVAVGPGREDEQRQQEQAHEAKITVFGSGCTGLINFPGTPQRLTYEEIQDRYPDLLLGLVKHPGIGWALVRSSENGDMVLGAHGIYFLDKDEVEGVNPLAVYGPNAVHHLKRQTSFEHCPDILVNTLYDPITEELCGFENQASHHGGLGGPQNHPFIIHPVALPVENDPIVGAENVYRLLRGWRVAVQGIEASPVKADGVVEVAKSFEQIGGQNGDQNSISGDGVEDSAPIENLSPGDSTRTSTPGASLPAN